MSGKTFLGCSAAGVLAGSLNGFFGAGGGMVLVPVLGHLTELPENILFPASLAILIPITLTSLILSGESLPWGPALPYLVGSLLGGLLAAGPGRRLSPGLLHKILGLVVLICGGRMLWT